MLGATYDVVHLVKLCFGMYQFRVYFEYEVTQFHSHLRRNNYDVCTFYLALAPLHRCFSPHQCSSPTPMLLPPPMLLTQLMLLFPTLTSFH